MQPERIRGGAVAAARHGQERRSSASGQRRPDAGRCAAAPMRGPDGLRCVNTRGSHAARAPDPQLVWALSRSRVEYYGAEARPFQLFTDDALPTPSPRSRRAAARDFRVGSCRKEATRADNAAGQPMTLRSASPRLAQGAPSTTGGERDGRSTASDPSDFAEVQQRARACLRCAGRQPHDGARRGHVEVQVRAAVRVVRAWSVGALGDDDAGRRIHGDLRPEISGVSGCTEAAEPTVPQEVALAAASARRRVGRRGGAHHRRSTSTWSTARTAM